MYIISFRHCIYCLEHTRESVSVDNRDLARVLLTTLQGCDKVQTFCVHHFGNGYMTELIDLKRDLSLNPEVFDKFRAPSDLDVLEISNVMRSKSWRFFNGVDFSVVKTDNERSKRELIDSVDFISSFKNSRIDMNNPEIRDIILRTIEPWI